MVEVSREDYKEIFRADSDGVVRTYDLLSPPVEFSPEERLGYDELAEDANDAAEALWWSESCVKAANQLEDEAR